MSHFWTLWPHLRGRWRPPEPPPWQHFESHFTDPSGRPVTLTGKLTPGDPRSLLVLVHGLGGSADSLYLKRTVIAAAKLGPTLLRLNLRGADRRGGDLYHAGLSSDLDQLLTDPLLAGFESILVLGFSVGGHVVLHFGTTVTDVRVRAVAGVCAPLDLAATVDDFDRPGLWLYRRYIFQGLETQMAALAERGAAPVPIERVKTLRRLREFDDIVVAPRFGFRNADHYYADVSVCHRLEHLRVPALLVASEGDPMVSARSIRSGLRISSPLQVVWTHRGGHVGFPPDENLGLGTGPVESQVVEWLLRQ